MSSNNDGRKAKKPPPAFIPTLPDDIRPINVSDIGEEVTRRVHAPVIYFSAQQEYEEHGVQGVSTSRNNGKTTKVKKPPPSYIPTVPPDISPINESVEKDTTSQAIDLSTTPKERRHGKVQAFTTHNAQMQELKTRNDRDKKKHARKPLPSFMPMVPYDVRPGIACDAEKEVTRRVHAPVIDSFSDATLSNVDGYSMDICPTKVALISGKLRTAEGSIASLETVSKTLRYRDNGPKIVALKILSTLTDSRIVSETTALSISKKILEADNEVGSKVLSLVADGSQGPEDTSGLRLLAMTTLSNTMQAVNGNIPGILKERLRPVLEKEIERASRNPQMGYLAARCFEQLLYDDYDVSKVDGLSGLGEKKQPFSQHRKDIYRKPPVLLDEAENTQQKPTKAGHQQTKWGGEVDHTALVTKLQKNNMEIKDLRSTLEMTKSKLAKVEAILELSKSNEERRVAVQPAQRRRSVSDSNVNECAVRNNNYLTSSAALDTPIASIENAPLEIHEGGPPTVENASLEIHEGGPPTGSHKPSMRRDRLVVMQGAPLVWFDGQQFFPMLPPDTDEEQWHLRESVEEVNALGLGEIDLVFEEATTKRFATLLATGHSSALHLTVHGEKNYLGMENDGALHSVSVHDLQGLLESSNGQLKLVFVAACHSQPSGEAFVKAGVKHVVCCKQDEELNDSASIIFAQAFYMSLASGNILQKSFEFARNALLLSPLVKDSKSEMEKYLLLPEKPEGDPYHDVPIFYTESVNHNRAVEQPAPQRVNPAPPVPSAFLGRQLPMYEILRQLKKVRCVFVNGPKGIGKSSLAKAFLKYVFDRPRQFPYKKYFWIPCIHNYHEDVPKELRHLFDMCKAGQSSRDKAIFQEKSRNIAIRLYSVRALLVIDARHIIRDAGMTDFGVFLNELLSATHFSKVLVVCPAGHDLPGHPCYDTAHVSLGPLDTRPSALLFGNSCKFVEQAYFPGIRTSEDLANLLVPEMPSCVPLPGYNEAMSNRHSEIFGIIGDGIPANIRQKAANITLAEYRHLIRLGIQQFKDVMLEASSQGMQDTLNELNGIRSSFPSLEELEPH